MDENKNTTQETEQKDQPRVFTQAEKDKEIAMIINREREKFKDYDTTKQELEALRTAQREKELAEKSEIEKLQTILSETTTELTNVKTEYTTLQKKHIRNDVLNGNKYLGLPRAYKNMVTLSDNPDEIIASADEVLAEFEKDTGKKVADTFGVPQPSDTTISTPQKEIKEPADLANSLRSLIASKIKLSNRG